MANEPLILNLDAILADVPTRSIIWQGEEHHIAGLTGETYLKFLRAQQQLRTAQQKNDEAALWLQNIEILGYLVPTLAAKREALLQLRLGPLLLLVQHVMAEFDATLTAAPGAAEAAAPGESTSPA